MVLMSFVSCDAPCGQNPRIKKIPFFQW